jgi:type VI secretion system protein ImpK
MNDVYNALQGTSTAAALDADLDRVALTPPTLPASSEAKGATPLSRDPAFSFNLRGDSVNPLVDASAPLMALMLRVETLTSHGALDELYKRCTHEIESIELELHRLGYDRVSILAHRYCLCTAIDEAILNSKWGSNSNWSQRSLLASFHNETWGGEKFFVILDRLMMEPSRYLDLLEFLYLTMCIGFQGKYRPMHNGRVQLEAIIKEVHDAIRKAKGHAEPLVLYRGENVVDRMHHVAWQTPVLLVLGIAVLIAAAVYAGFFFYTDNHVDVLLEQIGKVLGTSPK